MSGLTSFPGLPTVQFFFYRLQHAKRRGKAWSILVNDVSVYLGRQREEGGGVLHRKNELEVFSCNFCPKSWSFEHSRSEKCTALSSKQRTHVRNAFFWSGTPPPSVYLGRHWHYSHDKMDQAFPLYFCILQLIKNWTVGRPGNEATMCPHDPLNGRQSPAEFLFSSFIERVTHWSKIKPMPWQIFQLLPSDAVQDIAWKWCNKMCCSLTKERPLTKECPPLTFCQISCIASKFTRMSTPPPLPGVSFAWSLRSTALCVSEVRNFV